MRSRVKSCRSVTLFFDQRAANLLNAFSAIIAIFGPHVLIKKAPFFLCHLIYVKFIYYRSISVALHRRCRKVDVNSVSIKGKSRAPDLTSLQLSKAPHRDWFDLNIHVFLLQYKVIGIGHKFKEIALSLYKWFIHSITRSTQIIW